MDIPFVETFSVGFGGSVATQNRVVIDFIEEKRQDEKEKSFVNDLPRVIGRLIDNVTFDDVQTWIESPPVTIKSGRFVYDGEDLTGQNDEARAWTKVNSGKPNIVETTSFRKFTRRWDGDDVIEESSRELGLEEVNKVWKAYRDEFLTRAVGWVEAEDTTSSSSSTSWW